MIFNYFDKKGEIYVQKFNYKGKVIKKQFEKGGLCKLYTDLQYKLACELEADKTVRDFTSNVPVLNNTYTTDFVVNYDTGKIVAYECIADKNAIFRPKYVATLDEIKSEWYEKGVEYCFVLAKE